MSVHRSPFCLLQEELCDDAWKMLVACVLLNRTSFKQVRPVIKDLFTKYPTPESMSRADQAELALMLAKLGFQNRRARTLIRFSDEYARVSWVDLAELYGIGKYAVDSYDMFVMGRVAETVPNDKKLLAYRDWWMKANGSFGSRA